MIAGGPRTGKTTLSNELAGIAPVWHTDDLVGVAGWSESSAEVAKWMHRPGPWIIEGVTAVRALRKFMRNCPGKQPCDAVLWRPRAFVHLTPGQDRMRKACRTIMNEIAPELAARGVRVVEDLEDLGLTPDR